MKKMMMLAAVLAIAAAPLAFADGGTTEQDPGDWRYVAPQPASSAPAAPNVDGTQQQLTAETQQWKGSRNDGNVGVVSEHPDNSSKILGVIDGHATQQQLSTEVQQWKGSRTGGSSGTR